MEELEFNVIDCENATITTPTETDGGLIEEMQESPQTGSTNYRRYSIEISKNCCDETEILVPVFYNFTTNHTTCALDVEEETYTYGFNILGMNPLFISSLQISYDNGVTFSNLTYTNVTGNTGFAYTLVYDVADVTISSATFPDPPNTQNYNYILRIIHVDGFVYELSMRFVLEQPGGCNLISNQILQINYPEIDERVVFDNNSIELIPLYEFETSLETGVYQVIICRWYLSNPLTVTSLSSNCVQNNQFIECNLICDLINKLVQCKKTNIFTFYDALRYANECDTSYEDMCDLYELLVDKLENPDCRDPYDDCDCQGDCGEGFKKRPYSKNVQKKKNCGSCNGGH